jgi:undecaprenyl-diphosphatase
VAVPLALVVHAMRHALPGDLGVAEVVQSLLPVWWISHPLEEMSVISWPQYQTFVLVVVLCILLAMRRRLGALWLALTVGCADGTSYMANRVIQRPRPQAPGLHVDRLITNYFSFPSGHVVHFTALCGFLVFLTFLPSRPPAWVVPLRVILILWAVLMGISRILTGEHWPSDVLEGYLVGFFWLLVGVRIYRWIATQHPALRGHGERDDALPSPGA